MKHKRHTYIKKTLIPCLFFSGVTGIITGALIFAFKLCASKIFELSDKAYSFVRADMRYFPLLIAASLVLGLIAALLLKRDSTCRGGGIPTSIAILRGLIPFNWIKNIFLLFFSAMLTYLGGVPLGNEGPSVQMGTAVGRGTIKIFGKKNEAWERYIMAGGACAGFSAATGAPISGIFFAFEEAHRRFSPMIFMTAAVAVVTGDMTIKTLCHLVGITPDLFDCTLTETLPLRFIWAALLIGLVSALFAMLYTKLYSMTFSLFKTALKKIPFVAKITAVFVATSIIGLVGAEFLGTGHDLIEIMLHHGGVWYTILLWLAVRLILLLFANNAGVTGGLFIPSLAFGAMLGSITSTLLVSIGLVPENYYNILVVTAMVSFLAASSRTPITAIVFSVETLGAITNVLPIAAAVTLAYLTIESFGMKTFYDVVIESKVEKTHKGKTPSVIETHISVNDGSFAVGKEIRDILFPPTCTVLSVKKANGSVNVALETGDVLHIHYQTYDNDETQRLLEAIVGRGAAPTDTISHDEEKDDFVPEV